MIKTIPVKNGVYANKFTTEFSGKVYELIFHYNLRESKWYMDLRREDVDILSGVKVVNSTDLLAQYTAYDIPEGKILITDLNNLYQDPDSDNFGQTVLFQYDDLL